MMEDVLYCKDLHDPIEGDSAKPSSMPDKEWAKMHRKTIGCIRQCIEVSVFHHVSQETKADTLWKKLESLYERKTAQNKAFAIRKLAHLKLKEGRSVAEHLSEFQDLVNQLTRMNLVVDDELQALLLLSSLPDSWETLVVSLSNSAPNGVLQLAMVKDSLFNEETRRKDMGKDDAQALVTENRGRSKGRNSKGRGKSRSQSQTKGKVKCFYCDKEGHIKRNCKAWKNKQKEETNQKKADDHNTTAVSSDEDVVVLSIGEDECCHVADPYDEWVIDSAASYHVTPRREFFTSYKAGNLGRVKMGNKSYADIVGISDICVETNTGYTLKIEGCNGKWKLFKGSLVFARGKICCTLYKTQVKLCRDMVNAAQDDSMPDLWHRRLAHMSEKGLQILAKKSLIPFAKDLVYSDVCGPIEVESLGGNRYFVTFIDDASRKVWVYVLKTKDQVFQLFKKFHAMVEREKGKSLKCLRTDNGGEYTSNEFENYCSEYGIRHEKTVPGTPQHNGVAERINRTIVEKVRCMLRMAKLPKSFWAEAVQTACYLINRSPSVPLDFDIPERVWTGEDASYAHLKVFGCKTFAHVPKEQRLKLDDKATPCIFVGYGDAEFGYKLWDPKKKKMIRSRDVVFHENENIKDFEKSEKSKSTVEGVSDLTPTSSSSDIATDIEEVQVENYGDEPAGVDGDDAIDTEGVEQGEQPIPPEMEEPQVRRSTRERHPSTRYSTSEYVLITDEGEPESFQEVQSHKDKQSWMEAMHEEMNSLHKNNTYELVELPKGKKALRNKWVFKLKKDGEKLVKYKARLVVKGFNQKQGIDFDEIFSPVVKMSSIRVILGLTASLDLELEQMDVKTAFLHGDLEEEIYMVQPEGFEAKGKEHKVCRLKKSLYGLKQAPRQWYKKFDSFMVGQGYTRTDADHCVYVRQFPNGKFIILLLYVDDMLIVGQDANMVGSLKKELFKSFDMKDLGPARQILGMQILRDRKAKKLWLSQEKYVERVLERFNMKHAKPVSTPLGGHFKLSKKSCPSSNKEKENMASIPYSSAVGSLMYAMVCTRPDIAHAVGVVSSSKPVLEGYTDADMAGDLDGRKSTSGFLFTFARGAVSWQSKLQKCVALSTTEAEYIATIEAGKEMLWMKRFLQDLGLKQDEYVVHCDSQSALDLSKNSTYHSRTKHIDVRYHWLRLIVDQQLMQLRKIHTNKNPANMLTKVVPKEKLELCAGSAGMNSN
uniref:Integrase catalytic domain-containing protein n=1 Tax=Fagus sylvatica TaxID=28930 RepID=A0A2N9GFS8_FAGSY